MLRIKRMCVLRLHHSWLSLVTSKQHYSLSFASHFPSRTRIAGRRWRAAERWSRAGLWHHRERRRGAALSGAAAPGLRPRGEDGLLQLSKPAVAHHGPVPRAGGAAHSRVEPPAAQVHQVSCEKAPNQVCFQPNVKHGRWLLCSPPKERVLSRRSACCPQPRPQEEERLQSGGAGGGRGRRGGGRGRGGVW